MNLDIDRTGADETHIYARGLQQRPQTVAVFETRTSQSHLQSMHSTGFTKGSLKAVGGRYSGASSSPVGSDGHSITLRRCEAIPPQWFTQRVDPPLGSPTQVLDAEMEAELLHQML